MRRETFVTVENILRDFPCVCESLKTREIYLESLVKNSFITDPLVSGGDKQSRPEQITDLKIHDAEYCELLTIVETVGDCLKELPEELYKVVWFAYFGRNMDFEVADIVNYSERWSQYTRIKAIRLLVEPCLKVHLLINRWRQRENKRQIEAMTGYIINLNSIIT